MLELAAPAGGRETDRERETEDWVFCESASARKCSATDVEVSGEETATQDCTKS